MDWRKIGGLFVETFFGWTERKAPVFAAAIAYSTLFSLAPLLIISINLASLTINAATFETRLLETIEDQVGPERVCRVDNPGESGQRRFRGGFDHNATACRQGRTGFAGNHGRGEVPAFVVSQVP